MISLPRSAMSPRPIPSRWTPPSPRRCAPAEVTALSPDGLTVRVVLKQGVYHQIKRMFGVYGAGVNGLHRDAIGGLALDENLAPGQWRELSDDEVAEITRG